MLLDTMRKWEEWDCLRWVDDQGHSGLAMRQYGLSAVDPDWVGIIDGEGEHLGLDCENRSQLLSSTRLKFLVRDVPLGQSRLA